MEEGFREKRNITPEVAAGILERDGVEIDEKYLEEILDFLYLLANLSVNQYVDNNPK